MSVLDIAKNLRIYRELHNYTQEDIGRILNMKRQTYNHYENGQRSPSVDTLNILADLYAITLDDLMRSHQASLIAEDNAPYVDTKDESSIFSMNLNYMEVEIIQALRMLPFHSRSEILDYINFKKMNVSK